MIGESRTSAAITVANALSTGIGCAAGIELRVAAHVRVERQASDASPVLDIPGPSRTPVVEESLRAGLSHYFPDGGIRAQLSIDSGIPVARGLKSSSAVSTAVILAVARAAGRQPSALDVGRASAEVGRHVGVSATGALDDALAGLVPGFLLTDNPRGELLQRTAVDPSWGVVLYIPGTPHPPSPNVLSSFAGERSAGELVVAAAREGDWATAMRLNSELVERAMGYEYGEIRARLRAQGAIASGVSGLGPTLAAIAPIDRLPNLLRVLPDDAARKLIVPFSHSSASPEEVR